MATVLCDATDALASVKPVEVKPMPVECRQEPDQPLSDSPGADSRHQEAPGILAAKDWPSVPPLYGNTKGLGELIGQSGGEAVSMIGFPIGLSRDRVIEIAASCARSVFLQTRKMASPTYTLNERRFRYDNLWLPVGEMCVDRGIHPGRYVSVLQEYRYGKAFPNFLLGSNAFSVYDAAISAGRDDGCDDRWSNIKSHLDYCVKSFKTVCNDYPGLSPEKLFEMCASNLQGAVGWCCAKSLGLEAYASEMEHMAALAFIRPVYREVYSPVFWKLWPECPRIEKTAIIQAVSRG